MASIHLQRPFNPAAPHSHITYCGENMASVENSSIHPSLTTCMRCIQAAKITRKAWRIWSSYKDKRSGMTHTVTYWVESLPGDGGADWGYTEDSSKAIQLSPYWQRRFAKYCRDVNSAAHFA